MKVMLVLGIIALLVVGGIVVYNYTNHNYLNINEKFKVNEDNAPIIKQLRSLDNPKVSLKVEVEDGD